MPRATFLFVLKDPKLLHTIKQPLSSVLKQCCASGFFAGSEYGFGMRGYESGFGTRLKPPKKLEI
jgi:hypothetical protein